MVVLEDFESGELSWQSRSDSKDVAKAYSIQVENGNHFLHAAPIPGVEGRIIAKKTYINLKKTPYLKWRWRVHKLPKDGNERTKNDSAAGVYIFLQKGIKRRILKYCWSTTYTDKDWIESKSSTWLWKTKLKVLRQGPPLGEWVEEIVDIRKDFQEAFGMEAPQGSEGIGILTDGDQTNSESVADYDDFVLLSTLPTTTVK